MRAWPRCERRPGAPECVLHPDNAAARGLRAGQPVELFNERGAVTFVLRVSDETSPGVAFVPGQRPAGGEAVASTGQYAVLHRVQRYGRGRDLPEHAARGARSPPGLRARAGYASAPRAVRQRPLK